MSTSYDLTIVFNALKLVDSDKIYMIVMGEGSRIDALKEESRGLNVIYTGRLPYDQMCGILKSCEMVINPINGKSVATIINKHGDYAASGKPVLNTQKSKEYRLLIDNYKMGYNCDDERGISEKILFLIKNPEKRLSMGNNARKCARDCFDRNGTYQKLINVILE